MSIERWRDLPCLDVLGGRPDRYSVRVLKDGLEGGDGDFDLAVVRHFRGERLESDVRHEHRVHEDIVTEARADAQDLVADASDEPPGPFAGVDLIAARD